jgi:hypothetical protein
MRWKVRAMSVGILFLMAASAKGQLFQFTPPGGPDGRPETVEDRLEREMRDAPYRLGPIYIAPLVGFRDVAYVRDLFAGSGETASSDLSATAGAGFRAYLRTGRKVTWIAQALPEYVWWRKRDDWRTLNFSGGLETLLLFNRLTVDLAASRLEQQRIVTPEIPELVNAATDLARIDAELRATHQIRPFVSARWSRQEGLVDDREDPLYERVALLDREEQVVRGGVHWYPRSGWKIGLGAERSSVDFNRPVLDSSNEGTAPVLEVEIDRSRIYFNANLAARSLRATEGSRFVDYDGITGAVAFSILPQRRLETSVYANRQLVYSVSVSSPYLEDQRVGLAAETGFGQRVTARIFAETGDHDYVTFSPESPQQKDDLTAYGGSLRFLIVDNLAFILQATRLELDSNLPGADRSYTSGGITVVLRGNLMGRNL